MMTKSKKIRTACTIVLVTAVLVTIAITKWRCFSLLLPAWVLMPRMPRERTATGFWDFDFNELIVILTLFCGCWLVYAFFSLVPQDLGNEIAASPRVLLGVWALHMLAIGRLVHANASGGESGPAPAAAAIPPGAPMSPPSAQRS